MSWNICLLTFCSGCPAKNFTLNEPILHLSHAYTWVPNWCWRVRTPDKMTTTANSRSRVLNTTWDSCYIFLVYSFSYSAMIISDLIFLKSLTLPLLSQQMPLFHILQKKKSCQCEIIFFIRFIWFINLYMLNVNLIVFFFLHVVLKMVFVSLSSFF